MCLSSIYMKYTCSLHPYSGPLSPALMCLSSIYMKHSLLSVILLSKCDIIPPTCHYIGTPLNSLHAKCRKTSTRYYVSLREVQENMHPAFNECCNHSAV